MGNLSKNSSTTVWLFAITLCLLACSEQGVQLEKQKVQFSLTPALSSDGRAGDIDLPENSHARISVASSNGASILSDHEITISRIAGVYTTEPVELAPGAYIVTDFMIMDDSEDLYATPKKGAELATSLSDALPYNFSIAENTTANISMRVMDVRNQDLQKFGYTSSKAKGNTISLAVYESNTSLTGATAELRQNKKLLKTFSLAAAVNTINFAGDSKLPYTLTVYTDKSAKTKTFNMKDLKKEIGKKPLQLVLERALVLNVESYVDEGNETEEYFEFRMDGDGAVNVNWGDGYESATTLPTQLSHEYFSGDYTAIVTGDIDQITDFYGFSYGTIIMGITGLTNLTSLKVYNPSWGAVPIKVDLSNCNQLESIYVAKYGAPYEPIDLRTDFKLPTQHFISSFIFDASSFDSNREYISAEELEVMVNNIYNNVVTRQIYDGTFFVNPVVTPSALTQQKLDVLTDEYNWTVSFNDQGYDSEIARSKKISNSNASREQWLRERFSNSEQIIRRAKVFPSAN